MVLLMNGFASNEIKYGIHIPMYKNELIQIVYKLKLLQNHLSTTIQTCPEKRLKIVNIHTIAFIWLFRKIAILITKVQ